MKPRPKPETWDCRVARPGEWSQALQCWFGQLLQTDQLYSLYFQLEHEPGLAEGLWIARRDGDIDAAAWIIPGAERYIHCWPLRCRVGLAVHEKQTVAIQLWKAVSADYKACGAKYFQVNVPMQCNADRLQMLDIGFKEIARIQRLRLILKEPVIEDKCNLVLLDPSHQDHDAVFSEVMMETMVGSFDVPEINSYQSIEEVAAQYHKPGVERFLIRHIEQGIAGALAMEHDGVKGLIRYVGLISTERCKGLGYMAIQRAIAYLQLEGCDSVDLRVDARNEPALRLYRRAGFELVEEEAMMLFI